MKPKQWYIFTSESGEVYICRVKGRIKTGQKFEPESEVAEGMSAKSAVTVLVKCDIDANEALSALQTLEDLSNGGLNLIYNLEQMIQEALKNAIAEPCVKKSSKKLSAQKLWAENARKIAGI